MIETGGILTFVDKSRQIERGLFKVELRSDLQLMLSVEIRDENDQLLGKAHRSTSFVHCHQDYKVREEREGAEVKRLALRRKKDNDLIFELIKRSENVVEINGVFHVSGFPYPIIATPNFTRIGGVTLSHNTKVGGGRGIILTPQGIGF